MKLKTCPKCKSALPRGVFHRDNSKRDGLTTWCKQCIQSANSKWQRLPEVVERRNVRRREKYANNPRHYLDMSREGRIRRKKRIFDAYGGRCACCSEDRFEFLAIDHVNGGGNKHRREVTGLGAKFYKWLEQNHFPEGFRVLCHNCNMALGHFGYCPHGNLPKVNYPQRILVCEAIDAPLHADS